MTGSRSRRLRTIIAVAILAGEVAAAASQAPPVAGAADQAGKPAQPEVAWVRVAASDAATLTVNNRPIVTLRAQVLTRMPADRVSAAERRVHALVEKGVTGPVSQRSVLDVAIVTVGGADVLAITPGDADDLAGETQLQLVEEATRQLGLALPELAESRQPDRLLRAAGFLALYTVLLAVALWALRLVAQQIRSRTMRVIQERLAKARLSERIALDARQPLYWLEHALRTLVVVAGAALAYAWLSAVLQLFPFTRPWGESLGDALWSLVSRLALGVAHALPGLAYVTVVVLLTRFVIRLIGATLDGVERGRYALPGVYPETAAPTRRVIAAGLWLFALVVSYPYLPGSNTDAFKGVSVFLGLVFSLGSSGLVNHIMSGFQLTFGRAVKAGDFARFGDIYGRVTQVGLLATKLRTFQGEEIVIPNAVATGGTIVNYSRFASDGLLLSTTVTIGYDAPWRQVEALLQMAADRTPGLTKTPAPFVLQRALSDFYVEYQLNAGLERVEDRLRALSTLHQNIQDAFNEYGVQIMSPHYEGDPSGPKVVPRGAWHSAPALPGSPAGPKP